MLVLLEVCLVTDPILSELKDVRVSSLKHKVPTSRKKRLGSLTSPVKSITQNAYSHSLPFGCLKTRKKPRKPGGPNKWKDTRSLVSSGTALSRAWTGRLAVFSLETSRGVYGGVCFHSQSNDKSDYICLLLWSTFICPLFRMTSAATGPVARLHWCLFGLSCKW